MNILITGAKGFVGKNLAAQLSNIRDGKARYYAVSDDINIMEYDIDSAPELLDEYCSKADFVFNLAGINRPKDISEFIKGNFGFASTLLETLKKHHNTCPVMLSSSTQATLDNPYGESKRMGEELMFRYSKETGAKILVYRFPNIFGKWCRPNYNSGVATFCNNIANDIPITISDRNNVLNLVYIDDVVDELIGALTGNEHKDGIYCKVPVTYTKTLGEIVDKLYKFSEERPALGIPLVSDSFSKALYSTFLSYLPEEKMRYYLKMNVDNRGSFTEIIRTENHGQVSVNISKPGITKGEHWHNNRVEKFIVVSGKGLMQQRRVGLDENGKPYPVLNFEVSGDKLEVIEMIPGYTHNLINLSDTKELVTVIWGNDCFDASRPDTYFEPVEKK